jgi:hypothetical protein
MQTQEIKSIVQNKKGQEVHIMERVDELIKTKKISKNKFRTLCGLSVTFFRYTDNIGSGKIVKILTTFPDVSPDWLILGNGSMFRNNTIPNKDLSEQLEVENTSLKEKIILLEKIISLYENKNK